MSKEKNQIKGIKYIFVAVAIIVIFTLIVFIVMFKPFSMIPSKKDINSKVTDVISVNNEIVSYKYNNYLFEKKEGVWYNQVQRGAQPFIIAYTYGPLYVENMSIEFLPNDFERLTGPGKKVYLSFDHDSTNASYIATSAINLINNLKTVWGVSSQRACMKNSTNCAGAQIINCDNTKDSVVIQFIDSEKTSVTYKDNCLTIKSSRDNYIKSTERIILDWYKII